MKKSYILTFVFGGFINSIIITILLLFLSMPKKEQVKFVPAPKGFAVMIFDENAGDYIESDNLPIGGYKLNNEKSYCTNGGTIESYDDKNGKVNYSVDGTDECVIYLDIVEFELYKESNGYTFAWTENSAAESYNIYLDDTLLLNTTNTQEDLYKYIRNAGTYNVKASYVKSDGTEKFTSNTIYYTIDKTAPNTGFQYINYSGSRDAVNIEKIPVPSDFDYINIINLPKFGNSTLVSSYISYIDAGIDVNNNTFCSYASDNCLKYEFDSNNVIQPGYFYSNSSYRKAVDSTGHNIFNTELVKQSSIFQYTKGNAYFYKSTGITYNQSYEGTIFQYVKIGSAPSDWIAFNMLYHCVEENTYVYVYDERRKRFRKKKIKYIKPKDKLLVWDFDNGCFTMIEPLWIQEKKIADEYNELVFSDGSKLKTINQHRILNIESGKFTYPMTDDTPLGTTTFNAKGEKVTLISKRVVRKKVKYCNIITKYHMNLFTGEILTSCRFNNLYPIKDMKFVKDDRKLKTMKDYPGVDEKYFNGLRLSEQNESVHNGSEIEAKNTLDYVNNLKKNEKKNM